MYNESYSGVLVPLYTSPLTLNEYLFTITESVLLSVALLAKCKSVNEFIKQPKDFKAYYVLLV